MKGFLEDSNARLLAIGLVAIVVVAGIFIFAQKGEQPPKPDANGSALLGSEGAKALLSSFGRLERLGDYQYSFEREALGLKESVTLVSRGGQRLLVQQTPYDEQRIYFLGNETYICEKIGEREMLCASAANSSELTGYAKSRGGYFPEPSLLKLEEKKTELLIAKGALLFTSKPVQKEVNGIKCTEVSYLIDYGNLTLGDIASLGQRAEAANVTKCIDAETGFAAYLGYAGESGKFEVKATELSAKPNESLDLPLALTARRRVVAYLEEASNIGSTLVGCVRKTNADERDSCYATLAFSSSNTAFCEYIKGARKHDQCYITALSRVGQREEFCGKTSLLRDECYFELAARAYENDFCLKIANATLAANCTASVNESAKPPPVQPMCTKDSDCKRTGAFSQYCVKATEPDTGAGSAGDPALPCYNMTRCGCFEARCAWEQTDEYLTCIENAENLKASMLVDEEYKKALERLNATNSTNGSAANSS